MSTSIARILDSKGRDVLTTGTDDRLVDAIAAMTDHNVGAVVVVDGDRGVVGIVSERDVVRRVASLGASALDTSIGQVMTSPVSTCTVETTTDELMATMTEGRFRHIPVVEDDRLVGIVSIGDVVKWRLDELHTTTEQLTEYVTGSY